MAQLSLDDPPARSRVGPISAAAPRTPTPPAQSSRRTLPLRRIAKFAFGAALLVVGALATYQHVIVQVSRSAVINGQVIVLRAPIDGYATLPVTVPGSGIASEVALGEIVNPQPDDARVFQLQQFAAATQRERDVLVRQLADLKQARTGADAQAEAYRVGRVRQDELRVEEARQALAAAVAREAAALATDARTTALHQRGFQTDAARERDRGAREIAYHDRMAATKRLDALVAELEAARRGTYLGDNYNDVPSSFQWARQLSLRVDETQARLDELERKRETIAVDLAAETKRVADWGVATMISPYDGQLWAVYAASGEYVRKGQDLLSVLDCSTVLVTASVLERDFNQLRVGDGVRFRVAGTDREYRGEITKLGLTAAAGQSFAIPPAGNWDYQIAVGMPNLSQSDRDGCAVGRTGEVTFEAGGTKLPTRIVEAVRRLFGAA
jgi:multidrug resistance efflux pump